MLYIIYRTSYEFAENKDLNIDGSNVIRIFFSSGILMNIMLLWPF